MTRVDGDAGDHVGRRAVDAIGRVAIKAIFVGTEMEPVGGTYPAEIALCDHHGGDTEDWHREFGRFGIEFA
jgi:hypothetical protein